MHSDFEEMNVARNELHAPPGAADEAAREVLRVWVVGGADCQFSLRNGWEDPGVWGILMVDLLDHVANMYGGSDPVAVRRARDRVLELFDVRCHAD